MCALIRGVLNNQCLWYCTVHLYLYILGMSSWNMAITCKLLQQVIKIRDSVRSEDSTKPRTLPADMMHFTWRIWPGSLLLFLQHAKKSWEWRLGTRLTDILNGGLRWPGRTLNSIFVSQMRFSCFIFLTCNAIQLFSFRISKCNLAVLFLIFHYSKPIRFFSNATCHFTS